MIRRLTHALLVALALSLAAAPAPAQTEDAGGGYDMETILAKARGFFGETTEGLAEAIARVFADHGRPNAYIAGEEVSGAIAVGLRYGEGVFNRVSGETRKVYWQGPTVGFDLGGNASKAFVLIYGLGSTDELFQRFPGVEGSVYLIAGLGVNYQRAGGITLAPIRTGVGLRTGANVGYVHYTREQSWVPF